MATYSSFVETARLIFSQNDESQLSQLEEAISTNIVDPALADFEGGTDYASFGFINVEDYGAVGDLVGSTGTDNADAIQAALDAASAASLTKAVYFPPGDYYITRPLLALGGGVVVQGAGSDITSLNCLGLFNGPMLYMGPEEDDAPTTAAHASLGGLGYPLTNGSTSGSTNHFINLRDMEAMEELDGAAACNIRVKFVPDGTSSGYIFSAQGKRFETEDQEICFQLNNSTPLSMQAWLTVGGTQYGPISDGLDNMTAGALHDLEIDYNGTHIRLFVNGQIKATQAATGTVNFPAHMQVCCGRPTMEWPETQQGITVCQGHIDSISISKVSRHTSNYTPTTAKYARVDGNELAVVNFDDNDGMFVKGLAGAQGKESWLFVRRYGTNFITGNGLKGLTFVGGQSAGGPFVNRCVKFTGDDINCEFTRWGLNLRDNCFSSRVTYLRTLLTSNAWFGFFAAIGGLNIYQHFDLAGGQYAFVNKMGGCVLQSAYLYAANTGQMLLSGGAGSNTTFVGINVVTSDENTGGNVEFGIGMNAMDSALFLNCTVECAATDAPLVSFDTCNRIRFVNGLFYPYLSSTTAPLFEYLGGSASNEVHCVDPWVKFAGHPRCNTAGHVVYEGFGGDNYRGSATCSDANTTFAVDFTTAGFSDQPDTDYHLSVTPTSKTGSPASASNRVLEIAKTTTGFTVTLEAAPGAGTSRSFDWRVSRD